MSHLHPGPDMQVSPPSRVPRLHPGRASSPSRSRRAASQLHPYLISPYPNPRMCIPSHQNFHLTSIQVLSQPRLAIGPKTLFSPPSISWLTSIQVPTFASHLMSNLHSRQESHLSPTKIPSHTHPGLEICISAPPRSWFTSIKVMRIDLFQNNFSPSG